MPEFKCFKCDKMFETEVQLKQHVADKHSEKPAESPAISAHHPITHPHHSDSHHPQHGHKMKVKFDSRIIVAIVAALVVGVGGYFGYEYFSNQSPADDQAGTQPIVEQPIGVLGGIHTHADFALFLDGEEITPLAPRYFVRAPQAHVEAGAGAGSVIHMHATNVPLGNFFRTLNMRFDNNCFRLDNGKEYCSNENKTLKMFVRGSGGQWEESRQFHTYVFKDLDQILITYGDEAQQEIERQQDSVTQLSAANSDRQMDLSNIPR